MLLNQVYQYKDSNERIRVVFEAIEFIWLINIDDDSAVSLRQHSSTIKK